jgi:anaerobic magnesium-protoporphyrin IX monomethyl ester cyclase
MDGSEVTAVNLITIGTQESERHSDAEKAASRFDKVVVVNPPSPQGWVANRESHGGYGQLFPLGAPIAIALDIPYLISYLSEKLVPVDVIEAQGLGLDLQLLSSSVAKVCDQQPSQRILVVVRVALACLDWDLAVCEAIKNAAPSALLAVYGSIIPDVHQRVERESFLDYIIQGEPDETVFELAVGRRISDINGLHFREGGKWIRNAQRPLIKDLDNLPFPKWEHLPYDRYTLPKSATTGPLPYLPMLTSRGCPFGCHYCPYPVNQGLPFRFRSAENVVDEIERLVKDLGIQYIIFRDPMFSLRQDRVVAICNEIQRRRLSIRWKCETRVDCLNETTLRAMAAAGCEGINFGIESAEVEVQSNVGRKPITQKKILETVTLCRKLGIRTFCFFIVGLPGDTVKTILESIDFAVELQPSWVQFNAATPLTGTKLRAWAISKGFAHDDEFSYRTSHEATIGNENLSKEQVAGLYRFAALFERFLINRGGLFKDESRKGYFYRVLRSSTQWFAVRCARIILGIGRLHYRRAYPLGA